MIRFFSIFVFSLCIVPFSLHAQFSAKVSHHFAPAKVDEAEQLSDFSQFSLHYHTRLKRYRLEFQPGVHYLTDYDARDRRQGWGAEIPVAIYPLDFVNDCDCPTFSKGGTWLNKGLFLRLTPGWSRISGNTSSSAMDFKSVSVDAGIDWGISDLMTISPFLGYKYGSASGDSSFHAHYLQAGLQLLFRHDYRRRYR